MGAIIASHNIKMLAPAPTGDVPVDTCNCSSRTPCPLSGRCQAACLVYKATVTAPSRPTMVYYRSTEPPFKKRWYNHTQSFRHENYSTATELSKYVWDLKRAGLEATIRWEIAQRSTPYQCGSRRCDLCITEKTVIALADPKTLLNKRTELVSFCKHRSKFTCAEVLK